MVFVLGLALACSPATPAAEEIARGFLLSSRPELSVPAPENLRALRVQPAGAGTLVKLRPVYKSIEVIGADAAVRLDRRGRVRWSSARSFRLPDDFDFTPRITAAQALRLTAGPGLDHSRHARLVIYAGPAVAGPRLAWHLRFSRDLPPQTLRIYLDARDGRVISAENLVRRAPGHTARVFPVNPVESEDRTELTVFEDLPEDAVFLDDMDVAMLNCIDQRKCHPIRTTSGVRSIHYCEMIPRAAVNSQGNFLDHVRPQDDGDPEDTFAEVQAYHHIKTAYAAFRQWARDPDFKLRDKLTTIVNMRVPDLTSLVSTCRGERAPSASRLQIEENCYFWPAGGLGPEEIGDRIVLHQAHLTDWAYDGELVYHEFVHAVMNTTTPLAWRLHDRLGTDTGGGGIHEGFADYFAAAITGNPELCWYAGTTEDGPAYMSTIDNRVSCTDVLSGEEHEEGQAWSGALWAIRRSLRSQAKRDMFNRALFTVISGLGEFDSFPQAAALVLAELEWAAEEFIEEQGLGRDEAAKLRELVAAAEDRFAERGLPDCNGRVFSIWPGEEKAYLQLLGPNTFGMEAFAEQPLPATMQFRLEVPEDTPAIGLYALASYELDDSVKQNGLRDDPEIGVLVKAGGEPIEWTWDLPDGAHDAQWTAPVEIHNDPDRSAWARIAGPFPAGVYHLQLVNRGADWGLEGIGFLLANPDGGFDDKQDSIDPPVEKDAAGGCATTRLPGLPGLLLGLLVFTGWLRRSPVRNRPPE